MQIHANYFFKGVVSVFENGFNFSSYSLNEQFGGSDNREF